MYEVFKSDILPILTLIIVILLGLIMKNLLPNYFNEKGKNLATVQDISKITQLVEDVKYSFAKEIESLKANLQILTNVQIGIAGEERASIIDYNQKYFRWLNLLLDVSLKDTNDKDDAELDKHLVLIGDLYRDLIDSETKFKLFVENDILINIASDLKINTIQLLEPHLANFIFAIQRNNAAIEHMKKTTPIEEQFPKYKEYITLRHQLKDNFRKQIIDNYKEIVDLTKKFTTASREHIYKLISRATNPK